MALTVVIKNGKPEEALANLKSAIKLQSSDRSVKVVDDGDVRQVRREATADRTCGVYIRDQIAKRGDQSMKRTAFREVICAVILSSGMTWAQSSQDRQQVELLERDLHSDPQDVISRDFAEKHIAQNYIWMMPGGEKGRSDFVNAEPGQKVLDTRVKDVKVHILGDTAIANGFWLKRTEDGRRDIKWEGIFQDVWMKQNGSWKLVASATAPFHHENGGPHNK